MRARLDGLLSEEVEEVNGRISRFIWLRQFEVGKNSADINRLLDRLEFLQGIALSPAALDGVPARRVARLRRQGTRYFTDGLRDITSDRRLAILATCGRPPSQIPSSRHMTGSSGRSGGRQKDL